MINISMILCLIAGLFSLFALIKYFCIFKPDVHTNVFNAVPIMIGTLAWSSAAVTFYQNPAYNSPIDFERACMVVTWMIIIYRIKYYRDIVHKQQRQITKLTKQLTKRPQ